MKREKGIKELLETFQINRIKMEGEMEEWE